ncbi:MAG: FAD-dependent oxidoreductase [Actinomycetes bacterium]
MIEDADAVPRNTEITTDVAVIGGGAAGISLALALRGRGREVLVLESGRDSADERTSRLARADSTGEDYPVELSRLRYFGGSTNHWGGWCRPIESSTMAARPWVGAASWPISRTDLDRHYEAAARLCELPIDRSGRTEWDWSYWRAEFERSGTPPVLDDGVVTGSVFRLSPPTRFAPRYRDDLARDPGTRVVLGANVPRIALDERGDRVDHLPVRTVRGNRWRVRAREYVVAVGGLEVPRLLLLSARPGAAAPGDAGGHLGRWFMDHLEGYAGSIELERPPDPYLGSNLAYLRAALVLEPEQRAREELPAVAVVLSGGEPAVAQRTDARTGVSARAAAEVRRSVLGGASFAFDLGIRAETRPNPASRVVLAGERDAFGQRRAELRWRTSPADLADARRTLEIIGQRLSATGRGRIRLAFEDRTASGEQMQLVGFHHMGTTRMARRPEDGVVDAELRVHGCANLSVLSSSVFPSIGYENPTLTIVALAFRLADRLVAR